MTTDALSAHMPVDKGGLGGRDPARSRKNLQRACYGIAAAFLVGGVVMSCVFAVTAMIMFAIPITAFGMAGMALGIEKLSQRQQVTLWCAGVTDLVCTGIAMMPRELEPLMDALRDVGFMICTAASVLAGICAFLPPYKQGDGMLRAPAVIFCACTTMVSYLAVVFVCTPGAH